MKHSPFILLVLLVVACSTQDKGNKNKSQDTTLTTNTSIATNFFNDPNWVKYKDTVNMGFTVTFKYPKDLFAEHFQNGECLGKKKEIIGDHEGPNTTMDCCIWMDDIKEGGGIPIDTLIDYNIQKMGAASNVLKDTIRIANVKAIKVRYFKKNDNTKMLQESIYFNKFDASFEVINDSLTTTDFNKFWQSIQIDKYNNN